MRVVIDIDGQRETVELGAWQPSATLSRLVQESSGHQLEAGDRVYVDSAECTGATELREVTLLEGSLIAARPPAVLPHVRGWNVSLAGGITAGGVVGVPDHRELVVGRAPQADIVLPTDSASWTHCTFELEGAGVRLRDAGSTNGTIVDGERIGEDGILLTGPATALAGGAVLRVRPDLAESSAPAPGTLRNLTPAATAPFNRPPRPGRQEEAEPILPPSPKEVPPASKFNFITALAPLVLAGVMIVVMGDARFALFAALSPIMAIGMWFEQKHRRARNLAAEQDRFDRAVADFRADIAEAATRESLRRSEIIPDPALVLRRPALPSTLLWQRRSDADDFLALHAGVGDAPWRPEIDQRNAARLDDRVKETLEESRLAAAPVLVDLTDAGVVGIVGDRAGALALARSFVVQAAVHCGPADLTIGAFCDTGREEEWSWASWLPHTRQLGASGGRRWMASGRETSVAVLRGLNDDLSQLPTPALLVVLDSEVLTEGRDAPGRALLGQGRSARGGSRAVPPAQRVSGIVIASTADQLPAACTTVIEVGADAAATVRDLDDLTTVEDVILSGVGIADAEECARRLARFDDPELVVPGASLPSLVRLPHLLGLDSEVDAAAVRRLWEAPTGMSTPIGAGESGALSLDLVKDGPHGLVGGTTGSGKSEFLRSFVAGLAARNDPTRLTFILIDFKGGAAFKACERLPHTIGTISNLDEQLADRALRALEAEMQRRQRLFAAAGEDIDNLDAYLATGPEEPLPRILLVIDEFAMLAKDFPDVLASLVSIGAVGRTLGIHMILATQRPAGVVNEDILANTNLRVALRVQSREDSSNVIGVPSASSIGRAQTGRAYVKLGQDDITPVQTALVTGRVTRAASRAVDVRAVDVFGVPVPDAPERASVPAVDAVTDLDQLIDAIVEANALCGFAPPRPVWPQALGDSVLLDAVGGVRDEVIDVGLADDPDRQRQIPAGWNLSRGNLMVMGIAGSGTSTTLSSIALAAARALPPDELDILCLDVGSRDLAPLAELPHTVAYVGAGAGAKERQTRFLRHLLDEFERRRASAGPHRRSIVLLDGLATLRDEFQGYEGQQLLDALYRVYADGPAVGMSFAVSTTRAKAVPSAMDEVTTQKWLFRLADAFDYSSLGIRGKAIPASVPGRCVSTTTMLQTHVATPVDGVAHEVGAIRQRWTENDTKRDVIGVLPDVITVAELGEHAHLAGEPWRLPVGMREDTLAAAVLEVYEGEHVLVAGPARSGKSTLLLALAESLRAAGCAVWGIHDRRSPLAAAELDRVAASAEEIPAMLASLRLESGPVALLIDDAERVEDADQSIATLVASRRPGLCVIAAGRSSDVRALYSHWTKTVRKSRCGVILQPDADFDGELLSVSLPRHSPVALTAGRGYVCVGGDVALAQSLSPSEMF